MMLYLWVLSIYKATTTPQRIPSNKTFSRHHLSNREHFAAAKKIPGSKKCFHRETKNIAHDARDSNPANQAQKIRIIL